MSGGICIRLQSADQTGVGGQQYVGRAKRKAYDQNTILMVKHIEGGFIDDVGHLELAILIVYLASWIPIRKPL